MTCILGSTLALVSEDQVGVEQLLQRPLAFAGEVAVLEFLLLFICTLPHVTKLQQWMRNLPAPDTLKVSM